MNPPQLKGNRKRHLGAWVGLAGVLSFCISFAVNLARPETLSGLALVLVAGVSFLVFLIGVYMELRRNKDYEVNIGA